MLARVIIWLLQIAMMSKMAVALEHEKSFLLTDSPSWVYLICPYKNSILLPAYNDIVQRDTKTGEVQRTFRAHTKRPRTFVVTDDNRMISWGEYDMIIVWDLISGSIAKKIWLGPTPTEIKKIVFGNDQLFTCGFDAKIRQIDLTSGRTIQTINVGASVWAILLNDNYLYVGIDNCQGDLAKYLISQWKSQLSFVGHSNTVTAILAHNERIISADLDANIFSWNKETGETITQFFGLPKFTFAITIFDDGLYARGANSSIIRWKIDTGELVRQFGRSHTESIWSIAAADGKIFTGTVGGHVI
ncbi:hypothetical protein MP638_006776, partial [Amoeboaphelidium occidentale]